MSYASVLALINQFIISNGNNEITADVLRPILEAMLEQPNDLIGDLADLDTSDTTSIVNAINSIVSQNLPNATALRPIDTTGVDFDQDELLWVRDAINNTATNNGAFTCNLGEQMVFFCDVLIDIVGTEANIQRRYYRLTTGATLVNSLGSTLTPPLMPDGSSFNTIELTGDLVIDLGDIGTDDIEVAFNSHANQPFTISGDTFVQAIQNSENKLWQWIGGDGTFGNSATLATSTDFVDLTSNATPPIDYSPFTQFKVLNVSETQPTDVIEGFVHVTYADLTNKVTNILFPKSFSKYLQGMKGLYNINNNAFGVGIYNKTQEKWVGEASIDFGEVTVDYFDVTFSEENIDVSDVATGDIVDFRFSFYKTSEATPIPTENQIEFKIQEATVSGTFELDLATYSDFYLTMTADTELSFKAGTLPALGFGKRFKLVLTGAFAQTWADAYMNSFGDNYDGTKLNDVLCEVAHLAAGYRGEAINQQRETA